MKIEHDYYRIDPKQHCNLGDPITRLHGLLQTAMMIELSTLPPYLTALFSLKDNYNPQASSIIRSVLMEEMLHMTLAGNVLNAIGGKVNLLDPELIPSYPTALPHSDQSFIVHLQKFSESTIKTFMRIELPERPHAPPEADNYHTIGQFYAGVCTILKHACELLGEENVFSGEPNKQITPELYYGGGGKVVTVYNLDTALKALDVIVAQGEGNCDSLWDGDAAYFGQEREPAHYFRFKEILCGQHYSPTDSAQLPPSGSEFCVNYAQVHNIKSDPKSQDYEANPELAQANTQFNGLYTELLAQLQSAFSGHAQILKSAVATMYQMKYLAQVIMNTPYPGQPQYRAAPTFELLTQALLNELKDHSKRSNLQSQNPHSQHLSNQQQQQETSMTEQSQGNPMPSVPEGFNMPFVYSSLENCAVYYLVDKENVEPYFIGKGLKPVIFGDKHAMVSYNFQRYAAMFSNAASLTQEIEVNILCFPESEKNNIESVTPEQYLMGDDQTKLFGQMHVFVPCDNPIAINAGKSLFGEPKFDAKFEVNIPAANDPRIHSWDFKVAAPTSTEAKDFVFNCKVDVSTLPATMAGLSPITNYGTREGKLIGTRWNLFQVMPTYFMTPEQAKSCVSLTYGDSDYQEIKSTLKNLLGDSKPFAVRLFQSPPVATESRAYYP